MKFNSKLKIHIIYHYLEGDWEKAISKYLLAGAVLSSMSSEPEGLLSYIPFVAATRQQLQHTKGPSCSPPPETISQYLETSGKGVGAQTLPASEGAGTSVSQEET